MTEPAMPGPRRGLAHRISRARWAYAFILVPAILFLVFELYPFVRAVQFSVSSWTVTGPGDFVGLDNYVAIAGDRVFWKALGNTVAYAFFVVVGSVSLSLVLAAVIYPLAARAKTFFKMAFYLPAVASIVVVALVWRWMYQPAFGLFNHLAGLLGVGPFEFLTSTREALPSIMAM